MSSRSDDEACTRCGRLRPQGCGIVCLSSLLISWSPFSPYSILDFELSWAGRALTTRSR
jgi:hypothetical protein